MKRFSLAALFLALVLVMQACQSSSAEQKVIIYSNADDEAIAAMHKALDKRGFKGAYIIQSFGTSELGGRMVTEGKHIEADIITQASYFIDNAEEQTDMFKKFKTGRDVLADESPYHVPLLRNVGALFINTEALKKAGIEKPNSIIDLTKPQYKDQISFPSVMGSSTGWLLIQAVMDGYGDERGEKVLHKLIQNAGPHLESSGSAPLKKVMTGEVPIGFGLRSQALKAQKEGQPIETIDPVEGNFSLEEAIAIVDKPRTKERDKMILDMVHVIQNDAREDIIKDYPAAVYKDESVPAEAMPKNPQRWDGGLDVDLLEKHQKIFKHASLEN